MVRISTLLHLGFLTSRGRTSVLTGSSENSKVMVISYVCFRKAPCPMDTNSWLELLPHQDVVNLVVMLPVWASGLYHVHLLGELWGPRVFVSTRLLKVANSESLRPLSFVSVGST